MNEPSRNNEKLYAKKHYLKSDIERHFKQKNIATKNNTFTQYNTNYDKAIEFAIVFGERVTNHLHS